MSGSVVSDTGPLITLEKLPGGFELLRRLQEKILIPEQVMQELTDGFESADAYLKQYGVSDLIEVIPIDLPSELDLAELDPGEAAAIALAESRHLPLLIEERAGRSVAGDRGLKISGIAGQVLKAFRLELISATEAERMLLDLFKAHRINRRLFTALTEAVQQR